MNYLKKISFAAAACFAIAALLIILSSPEIFAMDQTAVDKCVAKCEISRQTCYNINPDKRLCEEEYKNCAEVCKTKYKAAPGQQEEQQQEQEQQQPPQLQKQKTAQPAK